MSDKVYCSKCRFYGPDICDCYYYLSEYCKANPVITDTHSEVVKLYAKPREKNGDNDCKDYQAKWYIKLRDRFTMKRGEK